MFQPHKSFGNILGREIAAAFHWLFYKANWLAFFPLPEKVFLGLMKTPRPDSVKIENHIETPSH